VLCDEVLNYLNRHKDRASDFRAFLGNLVRTMTGTTGCAASSPPTPARGSRISRSGVKNRPRPRVPERPTGSNSIARGKRLEVAQDHDGERVGARLELRPPVIVLLGLEEILRGA